MKEIFNRVAEAVSDIKFQFAALNSNNRDEILSVAEMFDGKRVTFTEFVQNTPNFASLVFSENLGEIMAENEDKKVKTWNDYFDFVEEAIKATGEEVYTTEEENGFSGQLSWRLDLLKEYYNKQPDGTQQMLDIYASKRDLEYLTYKSPETNYKLLKNAQEQLNNLTKEEVTQPKPKL